MKTILIALIFLLIGVNLLAQTEERKGFLGISLGPAFPIGNFGSRSINNPDAGFAKDGYINSFLNFGITYKNHLGFSAAILYGQNDIAQRETVDWWQIVGFTGGLMLTCNLTKKIVIDFKPRIGIILSDEVIDGYSTFATQGKGACLDLRTSFRYNIFKRWCLIAEAGYLFSPQLFGDRSKLTIQTITSGIGFACRF